MKFFLIGLVLIIVFDNLQGSTLPNKRSVRALNATLLTNINGTYQRQDPCNNTEIERTSYLATHQIHHHTKVSDWSNYTQKCSFLINSFLQSLKNLISSESHENGHFNFNINTTISQKHDGQIDDKLNCSLPTITIEATDLKIPAKSPCGNLQVVHWSEPNLGKEVKIRVQGKDYNCYPQEDVKSTKADGSENENNEYPSTVQYEPDGKFADSQTSENYFQTTTPDNTVTDLNYNTQLTDTLSENGYRRPQTDVTTDQLEITTAYPQVTLQNPQSNNRPEPNLNPFVSYPDQEYRAEENVRTPSPVYNEDNASGAFSAPQDVQSFYTTINPPYFGLRGTSPSSLQTNTFEDTVAPVGDQAVLESQSQPQTSETLLPSSPVNEAPSPVFPETAPSTIPSISSELPLEAAGEQSPVIENTKPLDFVTFSPEPQSTTFMNPDDKQSETPFVNYEQPFEPNSAQPEPDSQVKPIIPDQQTFENYGATALPEPYETFQVTSSTIGPQFPQSEIEPFNSLNSPLVPNETQSTTQKPCEDEEPQISTVPSQNSFTNDNSLSTSNLNTADTETTSNIPKDPLVTYYDEVVTETTTKIPQSSVTLAPIVTSAPYFESSANSPNSYFGGKDSNTNQTPITDATKRPENSFEGSDKLPWSRTIFADNQPINTVTTFSPQPQLDNTGYFPIPYFGSDHNDTANQAPVTANPQQQPISFDGSDKLSYPQTSFSDNQPSNTVTTFAPQTPVDNTGYSLYPYFPNEGYNTDAQAPVSVAPQQQPNSFDGSDNLSFPQTSYPDSLAPSTVTTFSPQPQIDNTGYSPNPYFEGDNYNTADQAPTTFAPHSPQNGFDGSDEMSFPQTSFTDNQPTSPPTTFAPQSQVDNTGYSPNPYFSNEGYSPDAQAPVTFAPQPQQNVFEGSNKLSSPQPPLVDNQVSNTITTFSPQPQVDNTGYSPNPYFGGEKFNTAGQAPVTDTPQQQSNSFDGNDKRSFPQTSFTDNQTSNTVTTFSPQPALDNTGYSPIPYFPNEDYTNDAQAPVTVSPQPQQNAFDGGDNLSFPQTPLADSQVSNTVITFSPEPQVDNTGYSPNPYFGGDNYNTNSQAPVTVAPQPQQNSFDASDKLSQPQTFENNLPANTYTTFSPQPALDTSSYTPNPYFTRDGFNNADQIPFTVAPQQQQSSNDDRKNKPLPQNYDANQHVSNTVTTFSPQLDNTGYSPNPYFDGDSYSTMNQPPVTFAPQQQRESSESSDNLSYPQTSFTDNQPPNFVTTFAPTPQADNNGYSPNSYSGGDNYNTADQAPVTDAPQPQKNSFEGSEKLSLQQTSFNDNQPTNTVNTFSPQPQADNTGYSPNPYLTSENYNTAYPAPTTFTPQLPQNGFDGSDKMSFPQTSFSDNQPTSTVTTFAPQTQVDNTGYSPNPYFPNEGYNTNAQAPVSVSPQPQQNAFDGSHNLSYPQTSFTESQPTSPATTFAPQPQLDNTGHSPNPYSASPEITPKSPKDTFVTYYDEVVTETTTVIPLSSVTVTPTVTSPPYFNTSTNSPNSYFGGNDSNADQTPSTVVPQPQDNSFEGSDNLPLPQTSSTDNQPSNFVTTFAPKPQLDNTGYSPNPYFSGDNYNIADQAPVTATPQPQQNGFDGGEKLSSPQTTFTDDQTFDTVKTFSPQPALGNTRYSPNSYFTEDGYSTDVQAPVTVAPQPQQNSFDANDKLSQPQTFENNQPANTYTTFSPQPQLDNSGYSPIPYFSNEGYSPDTQAPVTFAPQAQSNSFDSNDKLSFPQTSFTDNQPSNTVTTFTPQPQLDNTVNSPNPFFSGDNYNTAYPALITVAPQPQVNSFEGSDKSSMPQTSFADNQRANLVTTLPTIKESEAVTEEPCEDEQIPSVDTFEKPSYDNSSSVPSAVTDESQPAGYTDFPAYENVPTISQESRKPENPFTTYYDQIVFETTPQPPSSWNSQYTTLAPEAPSNEFTPTVQPFLTPVPEYKENSSAALKNVQPQAQPADQPNYGSTQTYPQNSDGTVTSELPTAFTNPPDTYENVSVLPAFQRGSTTIYDEIVTITTTPRPLPVIYSYDPTVGSQPEADNLLRHPDLITKNEKDPDVQFPFTTAPEFDQTSSTSGQQQQAQPQFPPNQPVDYEMSPQQFTEFSKTTNAPYEESQSSSETKDNTTYSPNPTNSDLESQPGILNSHPTTDGAVPGPEISTLRPQKDQFVTYYNDIVTETTSPRPQSYESSYISTLAPQTSINYSDQPLFDGGFTQAPSGLPTPSSDQKTPENSFVDYTTSASQPSYQPNLSEAPINDYSQFINNDEVTPAGEIPFAFAPEFTDNTSVENQSPTPLVTPEDKSLQDKPSKSSETPLYVETTPAFQPSVTKASEFSDYSFVTEADQQPQTFDDMVGQFTTTLAPSVSETQFPSTLTREGQLPNHGTVSQVEDDSKVPLIQSVSVTQIPDQFSNVSDQLPNHNQNSSPESYTNPIQQFYDYMSTTIAPESGTDCPDPEGINPEETKTQPEPFANIPTVPTNTSDQQEAFVPAGSSMSPQPDSFATSPPAVNDSTLQTETEPYIAYDQNPTLAPDTQIDATQYPTTYEYDSETSEPQNLGTSAPKVSPTNNLNEEVFSETTMSPTPDSQYQTTVLTDQFSVTQQPLYDFTSGPETQPEQPSDYLPSQPTTQLKEVPLDYSNTNFLTQPNTQTYVTDSPLITESFSTISPESSTTTNEPCDDEQSQTDTQKENIASPIEETQIPPSGAFESQPESFVTYGSGLSTQAPQYSSDQTLYSDKPTDRSLLSTKFPTYLATTAPQTTPQPPSEQNVYPDNPINESFPHSTHESPVTYDNFITTVAPEAQPQATSGQVSYTQGSMDEITPQPSYESSQFYNDSPATTAPQTQPNSSSNQIFYPDNSAYEPTTQPAYEPSVTNNDFITTIAPGTQPQASPDQVFFTNSPPFGTTSESVQETSAPNDDFQVTHAPQTQPEPSENYQETLTSPSPLFYTNKPFDSHTSHSVYGDMPATFAPEVQPQPSSDEDFYTNKPIDQPTQESLAFSEPTNTSQFQPQYPETLSNQYESALPTSTLPPFSPTPAKPEVSTITIVEETTTTRQPSPGGIYAFQYPHYTTEIPQDSFVTTIKPAEQSNTPNGAENQPETSQLPNDNLSADSTYQPFPAAAADSQPKDFVTEQPYSSFQPASLKPQPESSLNYANPSSNYSEAVTPPTQFTYESSYPEQSFLTTIRPETYSPTESPFEQQTPSNPPFASQPIPTSYSGQLPNFNVPQSDSFVTRQPADAYSPQNSFTPQPEQLGPYNQSPVSSENYNDQSPVQFSNKPDLEPSFTPTYAPQTTGYQVPEEKVVNYNGDIFTTPNPPTFAPQQELSSVQPNQIIENRYTTTLPPEIQEVQSTLGPNEKLIPFEDQFITTKKDGSTFPIYTMNPQNSTTPCGDCQTTTLMPAPAFPFTTPYPFYNETEVVTIVTEQNGLSPITTTSAPQSQPPTDAFYGQRSTFTPMPEAFVTQSPFSQPDFQTSSATPNDSSFLNTQSSPLVTSSPWELSSIEPQYINPNAGVSVAQDAANTLQPDSYTLVPDQSIHKTGSLRD